jgi:hypothetical protein
MVVECCLPSFSSMLEVSRAADFHRP